MTDTDGLSNQLDMIRHINVGQHTVNSTPFILTFGLTNSIDTNFTALSIRILCLRCVRWDTLWVRGWSRAVTVNLRFLFLLLPCTSRLP